MTAPQKETATTLFLSWGVPPERIRQALAVAAGELTTSDAPEIQPLARAVRAKDVAAALGVTRRTVRRYAVAGLLQPIYRGKGKVRRAVAYTAQSVNDFVNGKGAENA